MPGSGPQHETPLDELVAIMPFAVLLGIELQAASPDEVVASLQWREDLCTVGGLLHGGALMSFADSLGGLCAYLNLPSGAGTATISSSTNLLRAVREGRVRGRARPLRVGRSVIVVQTDLHNDAGTFVAQTTQAQAVIAPAPGSGAG
jgi:uncharacterized protein (TIGR00369 family)